MARASIPVDLFNPGQVFACLGLMEAAETLYGDASGGFLWREQGAPEFVLESAGSESVLRSVFEFLSNSTVEAVVPLRSELSVQKWIESWGVGQTSSVTYPSPMPKSAEPLSAHLVGDAGKILRVEHWVDGSSRDPFKLWTGAQGTPGAAVLARLVSQIQGEILKHTESPFDWALPQGSGFRLEWRRDYVPIDVGFSPNKHKERMVMAGYPLVEVLAVIGLGAARPARAGRGKLHYRYSVLGIADEAAELLPLTLHRAALGAAPLPFPQRFFEMALGWPGQEGQARCILEVKEEILS